jgi:DNA-binding beta-propeller fold protein YncE
VPLPGAPEGLAVDVPDGIVAVGVRSPDGVALVDLTTGAVRRMVQLPGAPRHLGLAGPRGPLLVPAEQVDTLYQVSLPDGAVLATTHVGHQPHDAAATASTIFVGNEYSNTVSVVQGGRQIATLPGPLQPGGVAASPDGAVVAVVGVRGRRIAAYTAAGEQLGSAPCGVGPTHVQAGSGRLFYVADTEGDAVLVFQIDTHGPTQVGRVTTAGGAPYGIALDAQRGLLYVTLTANNLLQSFRVTGQSLAADRTWPTVRQPNSVAVNESTSQAIVTGTADNQVQFIDAGAVG